ncbi:MAG: glycogen/starch/alpha-glucan phosphorylase, partial [bacterium]
GVAQLHSELLRTRVATDFAALWPDKFCNVTNGVTHRRWLRQCNPELAEMITGRIGDGWILNAEELKGLESHADDAEFQSGLLRIKRRNKERLCRLIQDRLGIVPDPASLFDVQVKRLHEYKRQMLNVLHIIALYLRLRDNSTLDIVPRTFVFGAKAAPSYGIAKRIIKLINNLARTFEADGRIRDRLRVVFIPDYNVSLAELIIPAADLSEQISTAGTEASGTGNMKLALNGALTIGTWDGANIEIAQAVGLDNIFIFGHRAEELESMRPIYQPMEWVERDPELQAVLETLRDDTFCPGEPGLFMDLWRTLTEWGDHYFHLADFRSYFDAQTQVTSLYRHPATWTHRVALNVSRMGGFSSDRAVQEYAKRIWNTHPVHPRAGRSPL